MSAASRADPCEGGGERGKLMRQYDRGWEEESDDLIAIH